MVGRKTPWTLFCLLLVWIMSMTIACSDDTQNNTGNNTPTPDMMGDTNPPVDMADMSSDQSPDQAPDQVTMDMVTPDMTVDDMTADMISPWDFGNPDQGVGFAITSIVPPSGPLEGGTFVRLKGERLIEGTTVFVGSRQMPVEISGTTMTGYIPAGTAVGPVTVKAISPSGEESTLKDAFTYTAGVRVTNITPNKIPTTGGVEVTIEGRGFVPETMVSFSGTNALRINYISDKLLRVIAPPRPRGVADVRITVPATSIVEKDAVRYFEPLKLLWVDPASGPVTGNQTTMLFGEGFTSEMTVQFGQQSAQVVQVDPAVGIATVTTPPQGVAGLVDVTLATADEAIRVENAYEYTDNTSPKLSAIRPNIGPEGGGTEVVLIGQGLNATNARFVFGTQEATIIEQKATYVRLSTPANAPSVVDVVFAVGQTERARLSNAFEYVAGLWLEQVSPAEGPTQGGNTVVLKGRGFDGVTQVQFGGLPATFTIDSSTQITATAPAHTAGTVNVTLQRGTLRSTMRDAYTYTEPLAIWGFSPTRGAIAGQTYVHVRGQGFDGDLEVTLDNVKAQVVRRIDSNNLYFYTPPHAPGEATLTISRQAESVDGPYPYEYFNPATRFGGASGNPINGAVNVSVYARGGSPIANAFVMLSTRPDTRYQGLTDPNGQVTLSGPDVLGAQSVTATAVGYSTATVQAVDAENVTIFLNQLDPRPGSGSGDPPPFGIIRGKVTTLGKLADPNDTRTYDMTIVRTTSPSIYGGNPDPGPGGVVLGAGNFEIITRIGDMAVVALCGVYNEDTQSFDAQYMGVRRFIFMSDQQIMENVSVACDIPLDQELDVKLINPIYSPTGPDNNLINTYWNFGFEGYFTSPGSTRGLGDLLTIRNQPVLSNDIADVSLILIGGSYTDVYAPFTQTSLSNVQDYTKLTTMPALLDVPEPVSPQPGGFIVNREIRWQSGGPYKPSFYILTLRNSRGIPIWSMVVPGNEQSARIPEFPDFSALPPDQRPEPYAQGELSLTLTAVRIPGFDFNQFTYEDLGADRWEAYAINRWSLSFPP